MQIHISTKDGIPIYKQIINQIKYMIASGRLNPGERLPPVRKLAETLLINPNTVARAYRDLEALGLVRTRQGSGVCISEGPSPLARAQKMKILAERADILLTEAQQMDINLEAIIDLLHERHTQLQS
ncbi:MAG: GntR family transcriptional regulator [Planctomycetes bacterium]|nr:GntR family transcriptional regulator [Planctomycetota bacterium]